MTIVKEVLKNALFYARLDINRLTGDIEEAKKSLSLTQKLIEQDNERLDNKYQEIAEIITSAELLGLTLEQDDAV